MFNKSYYLVLFLSVTLLSCSGDKYDRVDTSSEEKFKNSLSSITSSLPLMQQDRMEDAVSIIYEFRTSSNKGREDRKEELKNTLDKKTADQVFNIAEEIALVEGLHWDRASLLPVNLDKIYKERNESQEVKEMYKSIYKAVYVEIFPQRAPERGEGFFLRFNLLDKDRKIIEYNDVPLNTIISIISKNKVIFSKDLIVSSSEIGDLSIKKGILIPYSMFKKITEDENQEISIYVRVEGGGVFVSGTKDKIKLNTLR